MPNNNQSEEVERIVEEFIRDFTEPHPEGRTMYGRHTQPTERLIEVYRQTLTTHGASEYARGRSEERERCLKALPEEYIIHEYMPLENTPTRRGWNDYRMAAIEALSQENTLKE